ncbi:UDP-glucose 4-epimerase GalE [Mastigocoleus testarum]|uniref:UDP-glucose 4-epimerase n=1 Tax=Mastigocoleus testarum BC008 TaxID=371196 RepID=A0A0V7ZP11_9CYAN|nr:UDP-glucose 4-epimerase GalE [Mastigocoleus testarum]KST66006.1 UDP-glucose 4-epimerase [Mastigocoleus testarum BC008]
MTHKHKVLVTGGAGYIGSHVIRQLGEAGYDVVIYDNFSTGSPQAITQGKLVVGDLGNLERLYQVFAQHQFSTVLHFAASLIVPESVKYPLDYYTNNTRNTLNLLRCCQNMGVNQLVFSSTAAVYGEPKENPITESALTLPINPYGRSKLMSEWLIRDCGVSSSLRYVILRYFNVAGADSSGKLGQFSKNATHLIKLACDAVLDRRSNLQIFGNDFPTADGTGVRDYIHVEDLATAHLDALRYLEQGGESQVLNCGYGQGYSVRQVIEKVKTISGKDFPVIETQRRPGDPACAIANADKIHDVLGWKPKFNNLDKIIHSTLAWEVQKENFTSDLNTNIPIPHKLSLTS